MASALINVMSAAVIKAGRGLLRDFSEVGNLQISRKGTADFVTSADLRTEKLLQKELLAVRPNFGFLLEEGGEVKGKDVNTRWIIDPIDGTSNFIHAIPYFCISVGLEQTNSNGESEVVAGVIYDPIHNELFAAEKGNGAYLNDRKLKVSERNTIEDSLLVTGKAARNTGYDQEMFHLATSLSKSGAIVRYFGATALDLAYLAAGRLDACWYYTVKPWDIAAGLLLIREAGGIVQEMSGGAANTYSKSLICTNKHLQAPVLKLLTSPT